MTWATERLDAIKRPGAKGPPVVETLGLGLIDDWGGRLGPQTLAA